MRLRALVLVMGLVGPSWAGQMNDAQVRKLMVSGWWSVGSPVVLLFSILAVPAVALGYRNRYSL